MHRRTTPNRSPKQATPQSATRNRSVENCSLDRWMVVANPHYCTPELTGGAANSPSTTPELIGEAANPTCSTRQLTSGVANFPPIDTFFVEATKTASTAVMPESSTRLEIYRQAPGGAPELLGIGELGALSVTIDEIYIFTAGVTYEIWLQGRNSRGTSDPGPKVGYTPE